MEAVYKAAIGDVACTSCGNSGTKSGNTGSDAATDCIESRDVTAKSRDTLFTLSCGIHHITV